MLNPLRTFILRSAILLSFLPFFCSSSAAQGYFEIGYRAGLFLTPGGLNSIIKEYNAQNSWQQFRTVHAGLGGRVLYGAQTEHLSVFAGLKWLRSTQTVSGIDPATQMSNYKRLVVHYGGIVFGMHTNSESVLSAGFEVNAFNYFTLRYQESTTANVKSGNDNEIMNRVNPDLSLFVRIALWYGITGITLTPAIDIPVINSRNDISQLRTKWKLYAPAEPSYMRAYNTSITLSILLGKARR